MKKALFLDLAEQARIEMLGQNLKAAIDRMEAMLYVLPDSAIERSLSEISNAFEGLLNCLRRGIKDDNREDSFLQMYAQAWMLYYNLMRKYKCNQTDYAYSKAYDRSLLAVPYWIFNKNLEYKPETDGCEHVECYNSLFELLWTVPTLTEEDCNDLRIILNNEKILLEDRLLVVSALMISMLEYPDSRKLALLHELCHSDVLEIQIRAMVEMVILACCLDGYKLYGQELKCFVAFMMEGSNQDKLCRIIMDLNNAKYALAFAQQFNEKLMPLLRKQQDMDGKLKENPESPQVYIELQQLNDQVQESTKILERLTVNGKDLYFSAFRQFKSYPFFQNMANWLYPFSKKHKETKQIFDSDRVSFVKLFIDTCPFCDNDKWSIFFMLQSSRANVILPEGFEQQRVLPSKPRSWNAICSNYVHDLYRFYTCCPSIYGSLNPFALDLNPSRYPVFRENLDTAHKTEIAKLLLENSDYKAAIDILLECPVLGFKQHKILAQCYMRTEEIEKAAKYYKLCLDEKEETKTKKQLVICYKRLLMWREALPLLEDLAGTDIKNQTQYELQHAYCLIKLGRYEKALQLLYKIEFQNTNQQALGYIVWCNLRLKLPEKSLRYWKKLKRKQPNDWLNGGHTYWALGDLRNAYLCYLKFFSTHEDRGEAFDMFWEDIPILESFGIGDTDINLMLQALD